MTLLSAHADIEPVEELRGRHGEDGSEQWNYWNKLLLATEYKLHIKLTSGVGCQDNFKDFFLSFVQHQVVEEDESIPVDSDRHRDGSVHHHHQSVKSEPEHAEPVILHNSPSQNEHNNITFMNNKKKK